MTHTPLLVAFRYLHKELPPLDIGLWIAHLGPEERERVSDQAQSPWSPWSSKAIRFLIDQRDPVVMEIAERVGEHNLRQLSALAPLDLDAFRKDVLAYA